MDEQKAERMRQKCRCHQVHWVNLNEIFKLFTVSLFTLHLDSNILDVSAFKSNCGHLEKTYHSGGK